MNRPLLIGNWKMHGDGSSLPTIGAIAAAAAVVPAVDTALCLPATLIHRAATRYPSLAIGAQDCHADAGGAYTGEVAAAMIRDAGGTLVILGHSERRLGGRETDDGVAAKVRAAQAAGLRAIVCVGEPAEARTAGQALTVTGEQLRRSLRGTDVAHVVVAYEPVWAIGRGVTPSAAEVRDIATGLRRQFAAETGGVTQIIYGGSVTPATCTGLLRDGGIDGFLVGKASLDAPAFTDILAIIAGAGQSMPAPA